VSVGKGALVRTIVLAGVFLCACEEALPAEQSPAESAPSGVLVSDLTVPVELGHIVSAHDPGVRRSPIVVQIQEAHSNYEGQKNLASILGDLITRHGLRLVLVEGGEGDVGLAYLREYGPASVRTEIAEQYLKAGVISGEEYLDVISDHPLVLWGVEDQALYETNVDAFLKADELRQAHQPTLLTVRRAAEALVPSLLSSRLAELEQRARAYEEGTLGLGEYASYLDTLAKQEGLSEQAYPQAARFLLVRELEDAITYETIAKDQQALIEALSRRLSETELGALVEKAKAMQAGRLPKETFYRHLEQAARNSGLDLADHANLMRYMRYVEQRRLIEPPRLAQELEAMSRQLRERLAATADARQLAALLEELDLIEKLIALRLSPEELRRFDALKRPGLVESWGSFLQAHGAASVPAERLSELVLALADFEHFYEVATQRNEALVDRAVAKVRESGEPLAALITGGFHAPEITRRLTGCDMQHAVPGEASCP